MHLLRGSVVALVGMLLSVATPSVSCAGEANGTASVEIAQAISVTRTADLYFGAFIKGPGFATSDQIEVPSTGGPATYSDVSHFLPLPGHPTHPASFTVTGSPGFDVSVTLPPHNLSMGPGIRLQTVFEDPPLATGFTIPSTGSVTYRVGGRLQITNASAVAAGNYATQFTLTVNYE